MMTGKERVMAAFRGDVADYVPFAPNINLWFYYNLYRGTLPPEVAGAHHPVEVLRYLGAEVLARWDALWALRQVYTAGQHSEEWGGSSPLREERITAFNVFPPGKSERSQRFVTPYGTLTQRWCYSPEAGADFEAKHWWTDWDEYPAIRFMLEAREYQFDAELFRSSVKRVGDDGVMMCHVSHCPLKELHWLAGPANATLFIADHPQEMLELAKIHEAKALRLMEQIVDETDADVFISGDNLDSSFYSPRLHRDFAARFYERCSEIAHRRGKAFVIHACGRSKRLLPEVGATGVDCLEGITPPPMGDIELGAVRQLTGNPSFVVNGGMDTPHLEITEDAESRIHTYTRGLFASMGDRSRFIFASSCMTPVLTPWRNLVYFRDAAREHGRLY